jgi:predicted transcriptional regulator
MPRREDLILAIRKTGLTRLEFSERLGVPYSTITSRLAGYSPMTEEQAEKIRAVCAAARAEADGGSA